MPTSAIQLETSGDILTVTIDRIDQKNSIDPQLLIDLHRALDTAEQNPQCHAMIIQGKNGLFCTGMDFQQVTRDVVAGNPINVSAENYMALLKRFTLSPKLIIAKVDGRVLAGGVGIVAASDIVISTSRSTFALSEAMWGLLPANVMPFLIRRIGFQPAYLMTLTTRELAAEKAHELHLVDELTENLEDTLRKLMINLRRLTHPTISEAKQFFRKMWVIDEEIENIAIQQLQKLIAEPTVINNITNFVLKQQFPWEKNLS